jgi:hypothetical protein
MKRTTILALVALAAAGCVDLGLEGNIPEEEATVAPPSPLVAAVTATAGHEALIVDGRQWIPAGHPMAMGIQELVPVGSAMGSTVYARSWDSRPYDELFTRIETVRQPLELEAREWQRHVPVLGGAGAGAIRHSLDEAGGGHSGEAADEPGH